MRFPVLARTWDFLVGRKTRRSPFVRLTALPLEDRITPTGRPLPLPFIFVGGGGGVPPLVRAYYAETGALAFEKQPFATGFTGGVRVGTGDIDHDGIPDLIAAAGPGGGPRVVIYSGKTGNQLSGPLGSFYAYDPAFTGGVSVASGDVNGDGIHDVITAAGAGGTPHVKVFSGRTGQLLASFQAFDTGFRGGATVMAADFTGDGKAELVVGAGTGGGPNVRVFDLNTGNPLPPPLGNFFAFDESFTGGVDVGTDVLTGDVTGDGRADIAVGRGAGAGSLVRVFDGVMGKQVREFSPFGSGMMAGVRVATAFIDDDQYADIVAATGAGVSAQVKVFSGLTGTELASPMSPYMPFGSAFTGGLSVAASNDPPVGKPFINRFADAWELDPDGSAHGKFAVTRIGGTGSITVHYSVTGGTATAGVDYTLPSVSGTVTLDDGVMVAYIDVVPIADSIFEGAETVEVTLQAGAGYQLSTPVVATLSILDAGDLDIIDSNGVEVAEDKEENPGGWVAVNNDNDNYNFLGDAAAQATSLLHKFDKDESVKVEGENDLVKIRVNAVGAGVAGEVFVLNWDTAQKIKVWKTADKDGELKSSDEVPMGESSYWVEGLNLSDGMGDQPIRLYYCDGAATKLADQVNFTVYQVDGAMNVPGYSKYTYLAQAVGGAPRFEAGNQSTIVVQGPRPVPWQNGQFADILWGAGAAVGVYRVYPTAANNFFVNREVNVVKIAFSPGGADNRLKFGGPPFQDADSLVLIRSATDVGVNKAMTATLKVTHVEGPVVTPGGFQRGVRFMEYGFVQNVTITQMHADYDDIATGKRLRMCTLEGRSYLDGDADPGPDEPWFETAGGVESPDDPVGQGNLVPATTLGISDSPGLSATDNTTLTVAGPNGMGAPLTDYVDRFWVTLDFALYFATRTLDKSLASDSVYTQRASAYWTFDGSGTISQGDPNNKYAGKGKWQAAANRAGNRMTCDCDPEFVEVSNGIVVPITGGPTANHVAQNPGDYDVRWETKVNPN